MKKIFLVLTVTMLALSSLYAQDDTNAQTENEQSSEEETMDTVEGISAFSPSFTDLRHTDDQSLD